MASSLTSGGRGPVATDRTGLRYGGPIPRYGTDQAEFFRTRFNTTLTPEEEQQFRVWAAQQQPPRNPDLETEDYDLRGFWQSGGALAGNGHASDAFKKPNHPTFSVHSRWHGTPTPAGGTYRGGQWLLPDPIKGEERGRFQPSAEMLETTHPLPWLQSYMRRAEPEYDLLLPTGLRQE